MSYFYIKVFVTVSAWTQIEKTVLFYEPWFDLRYSIKLLRLNI